MPSASGLGYLLATLVVFGVKPTLTGVLTYPSVDLGLYLVGAALLEVLVKQLDVPTRLAPLLVVAISFPLKFLLTRVVVMSTSAKRLDSSTL